MSANLTHADIEAVRDASRKMVRDLGFMRPTIAETDLSPSAVHALIEIGNSSRMTARQLGRILLLEKSSISRMLARLIALGLIRETASPEDGRYKTLWLTEAGLQMHADIDRFANLQVGRALHGLDRQVRASVVFGLKAYAEALAIARGHKAKDQTPDIRLEHGLRPGAIGRITEMHARYYSCEWGFSSYFEARVASGLAEFSQRLDRPMNRLWLAMKNGEIVGSAAIDGEDLGSGQAHLRWVIVDETARGSGCGRKLLEAALDFCDRSDFSEIRLWTFKGLDAARGLYESCGFELTEEWQGDQWGSSVTEQQFVRKKY